MVEEGEGRSAKGGNRGRRREEGREGGRKEKTSH
jgi:hypothetical protein